MLPFEKRVSWLCTKPTTVGRSVFSLEMIVCSKIDGKIRSTFEEISYFSKSSKVLADGLPDRFALELFDNKEGEKY